jgi:16S rRNA (uracil1498-N3)-methyltransferase
VLEYSVRIPRIFQDFPLAEAQTIELEAQAAVHIARVLRLREGDVVVVFNGKGGEYHGCISQLQKRSVQVQLQEFKDSEVESPLDIVLAQGISRGERMDFTVQKAVELGVKQIQPLVSERTVVNLNSERKQRRREHWQSIVQSACEQSGRNFVPLVNEVESLPVWVNKLGGGNKFVLNHRAAQGVQDLRVDTTQPVYMLIGPEGGLNSAEIEHAEETGFISVRLGPRVLRTETAALAFISLLQARWGDFA